MNKFKKVKLEDITLNLDKLRIPLSSNERSKLAKIYPYYGAQSIVDYVDKYLFDGEYLLVAEDGENLKSQNSNVCNYVTGKFWVNNHAHILEAKNNNSLKYIYYLLNLRDFRPYVTGSAQPKLTQDNLKNMELLIHQPIDQQKIATVLSSIDSKIELNNRINVELESMAKTLYDYWFVQFDFPDPSTSSRQAGKPYKTSGGKMVWNEDLKREIPEGWEVLKLSTKLTFEKGIEPGSAEYVEHKVSIHHVKFIRVGDVDGSSAIFIDTRYKNYAMVSERDVLVTFDGSVGKVAYGLEGAFSGGLRRIFDKSGVVDSSLIYFIFKEEKINKTIHKYATGSILLHAGSSIDVLKIPFKEKIYLDYQNTIIAFYNKMVINKKETQKLTELRDWLLPMLMNGQVKVN